MRKRLPPAPPKLPDGLMYDPGSNEVVPAESINQECKNALSRHDRLLSIGLRSWDDYRNDPSYWWKRAK